MSLKSILECFKIYEWVNHSEYFRALFYKKCGYYLKLSINTITFDRAGVLGQPFSLALKTCCRHRTEQEKERMKNSS